MLSIDNNFHTEKSNMDLTILLIKNEYKYKIIGILKQDGKITDYCETIEIASSKDAHRIYNVLIENEVFPCHFYNIMDDMANNI